MKLFRFISYLPTKRNKQPFYHAQTKENIRIKLFSENNFQNDQPLLNRKRPAEKQQKNDKIQL